MSKYRVTRSRTMRRAENADVKDGTIRAGAKGNTKRRWNAKKGRWEKLSVVARRGVAFDARKNRPGAANNPSDTETPPPKISTLKSGYQTGAGQTTRNKESKGSGSSASESKFAGQRDPEKGYQTGSGVYTKNTDKKKAAAEAAYLKAQAAKAADRKETLKEVIDAKDQIPDGQIKITKSGNLENKYRWNKKKSQYILTHRRNKGQNWRLI